MPHEIKQQSINPKQSSSIEFFSPKQFHIEESSLSNSYSSVCLIDSKPDYNFIITLLLLPLPHCLTSNMFSASSLQLTQVTTSLNPLCCILTSFTSFSFYSHRITITDLRFHQLGAIIASDFHESLSFLNQTRQRVAKGGHHPSDILSEITYFVCITDFVICGCSRVQLCKQQGSCVNSKVYLLYQLMCLSNTFTSDYIHQTD